MQAQKQPSEDVDLNYLKNIKRAHTFKMQDPEDELDGLFEDLDLPKTQSIAPS